LCRCQRWIQELTKSSGMSFQPTRIKPTAISSSPSNGKGATLPAEQSLITDLFVAARAIHFGACLLILCFCIFQLGIINQRGRATPAMIENRWRRFARKMIGWSLVFALLSGVAWLLLASLNMSDWEPGESFPWLAVKIVWRETQFGSLWKIRLGLWAIVFVCAAPVMIGRGNLSARAKWIFLPASALLGSLAWAGHGTEGSPYALHVAADVVHLLIGAAWPVGLFPLLLVLFAARKLPADDKQSYLPVLVARFSAMSLIAVSLLVASGVVNSLFLLGPWSNFLYVSYGRLLLAKIAMTAGAVLLGAVNLLILRQRLTARESAQRKLCISVAVELTFSVLIIFIVGWLGLMQPGNK